MTDRFSFAHGSNTTYVEALYQVFLQDPTEVDPSWQAFFAGYQLALQPGAGGASISEDNSTGLLHAKVEAFINAYRRLGHLYAWLNPLETAKPVPVDLQPAAHGLADVAPTAQFHTSNFFSQSPMSFQDIFDKLQATYCGSIGADFRDINNIEAITWLQSEMESCTNRPSVPVALQKRIAEKLAQAEGLERFLQTRFLGQKRFSVEGLDTLLPLLDILIDQAAQQGAQEVCMGMAHRGRLNVLCNIMEKPYELLIQEFEGSGFNPFNIDGDVKYHKGFAKEVETFSQKRMRLYLSPNPSHLEFVNPVVEGFVRCRQELQGNAAAIVPVLLHGDAAFIGQGVVPETLNLSQLDGYATQGTIHIITNNQIGFTTNPTDSRSCPYSSDIAKTVHAPVFHVNANDAEAVAWVAILAVKFRQKFQRDVVIDLIGYRRYGHNETDEPAFTQPVMYQQIKSMPTVFSLYTTALLEKGVLTKTEVSQLESQVRETLQAAHQKVKEGKVEAAAYPSSFDNIFTKHTISRAEILAEIKTALPKARLQSLATQLVRPPTGFMLHPKIEKLLQSRADMAQGTGALDWGFAELVAFGSLAQDGVRVRLSGQDCKRGTFSSRHGVWFDAQTNQAFEPLNHIEAKGTVQIINSPLSEQGCLGFEFGYSLADPNALVLWEAQFGDFVNGAQVIIDQFLVASEAKWNQKSGLVLLLPHGYEGMGPEHSSARPERFLQLCGNLNIQVCNVTTPAQLFHLLRRQMGRTFRKPLILLTPKSLLRHPSVVSNWSAFTTGTFCEILDDTTIQKKKKVERLLLCTGKIYYELCEARALSPECVETLPILRFEQLYPFPKERFQELMIQYPNVKSWTWVQEEPQNMGFWNFMAPRLRPLLGDRELEYIGRKASGSTAEGSAKSHQVEQQRIVQEALSHVCGWRPTR